MQSTLITFDPVGGLFSSLTDIEPTIGVQWFHCESFEEMLAHLQNHHGGTVVVPDSQIKSVESCIGTKQTDWMLVVVAKDRESGSLLAEQRPNYTVLTRFELRETLISLIDSHSNTGRSSQSEEAHFETLGDDLDFESMETGDVDSVFTADELDAFEAEMEQAFSAVGAFDLDEPLGLSRLDDEKAEADQGNQTTELTLDDLDDLEDIRGVFDASSSHTGERETRESEADTTSEHFGLLVETQVVDPDMVLDSELSDEDLSIDESVFSSTPLEATQIIRDDDIDAVFASSTQIVEESMVESVAIEGTQVVDDSMVESVAIDGTQVVDDSMVESVDVDGTQVVDDSMVQSVAIDGTQVVEASMIESTSYDSPSPVNESMVLNSVEQDAFSTNGLLNAGIHNNNETASDWEQDFDEEMSLLGEDNDGMGDLRVNGDELEPMDFDSVQDIVEVDDSQVVERTDEASTNPRNIMAVDADMVLETLADEPDTAELTDTAVKPQPKTEDQITLRKRLLELQLDLKLSKEQVQALQVEVDQKRSVERELRDQVRTGDIKRREVEQYVTKLEQSLTDFDARHEKTQLELERLSAANVAIQSEMGDSLNRQSMLESAREAAEYELELVSKRYDETKVRLDKVKSELGDLELEFKDAKKKFKEELERTQGEQSETEKERRNELRKLNEQLHNLEKIIANRDQHIVSLGEQKEKLELKLAEAQSGYESQLSTLRSTSSISEEELKSRVAELEKKVKDLTETAGVAEQTHIHEIAQLNTTHAEQIKSLKEQHKHDLSALIERQESALKAALDGQELLMKQAQDQSAAAIKSAQLEASEKLDALKATHLAQLEELDDKLTAAKESGEAKLIALRAELSEQHRQDLEQKELTQLEALERQATRLRKEYDHQLETRLKDHGGSLAQLREKYQTDIAQLRASHEEKIATLTGQGEVELTRLKEAHRNELEGLEKSLREQIELAQETATSRIDELRASHKASQEQSENKHSSVLKTLRDEHSAALESLKSAHRIEIDTMTEKASVALEALRAELGGRQAELESKLKSEADARLQGVKDDALRQRTDLEGQVAVLNQTIDELKTEVERARLGAHERVRSEALAESASQIADLESQLRDAGERFEVTEANWETKYAALEEELKVKLLQAEEEKKTFREATAAAEERTAQVSLELNEVRQLLSDGSLRNDQLRQELDQEVMKSDQLSSELKQGNKTMEALREELSQSRVSAENLAKEFAAKAKDLESSYQIDLTLREELEASLTNMGQSLAQREMEVTSLKETIDGLNDRVEHLGKANHQLEQNSQELKQRFTKLKAFLLLDEHKEVE